MSESVIVNALGENFWKETLTAFVTELNNLLQIKEVKDAVIGVIASLIVLKIIGFLFGNKLRNKIKFIDDLISAAENLRIKK